MISGSDPVEYVLEDLKTSPVVDSKRLLESTHKALDFMVGHNCRKPYVKFISIQHDGKYSIHPLVKIKLHNGKSSRTRTTKTVLLGHTIFIQILSGFGVNSLQSTVIHSWLESRNSFEFFRAKEQYYQKVFDEFIRSDKFDEEVKNGRDKVILQLNKKITSEVRSRFRLLMSMGHDESYVRGLFNQIEIENVFRT